MATQCHNVPGGIWGAALSLLLDPLECSLARQQVCTVLLLNLVRFCATVVVVSEIWQFEFETVLNVDATFSHFIDLPCVDDATESSQAVHKFIPEMA
jgi:hypothetical protein